MNYPRLVLYRYVAAALVTILCTVFGFSQQLPFDPKDLVDTDTLAPQGPYYEVRQEAEQLRVDYLAKFEDRKKHSKQMQLLSALRKKYDANLHLFRHSKTDSLRYEREIAQLKSDRKIAVKHMYDEVDTVISARHLATTEMLILEIEERLQDLKDEADKKYTNLLLLRSEIDSMSSDSGIYVIPVDTGLLQEYWVIMRSLNAAAVGMYQSLNGDIAHLSKKIIDIEKLHGDLKNDIRVLEITRLYLAALSAQSVMPNWLSRSHDTDSIPEVIASSLAKDKLAMSYYIGNNKYQILLVFGLFFFLIARFFKRLKKKLYLHSTDYVKEKHFLLNRPVLLAGFIVLNCGQFFLTHVPFIFQAHIWGLSILLLTVLVRQIWSKKEFLMWLLLALIFMTAILLNVILKASELERTILAFLSVVGIGLGVVYRRNRVREIRGAKWFNLAVIVAIIFQIASLGANVLGLYNMTKLGTISSIVLVGSAILLHWTYVMILEVLKYAKELYQMQSNEIMESKIDKLIAMAPRILHPALVIGWLVLFSRNFYIQHFFNRLVDYVLYTVRHVGEYEFTISSVVTFILIIVVSVFVARVISFFASSTRWDNPSQGHSDISNWLLLIRIGVVGLGVIIAFLAAGVPLDKLTILIGSLGVGIGFGLQSIVNNLFSGVIIAFERPFHIGDLIEANGLTGVVKEIGIRSSKVKTYDGSDVIIPNGDLLNQSLVNWTLSDRRRRIEMFMGVAYGSDLQQVKSIILDILQSHSMILPSPAPAVLLHQFSDSSIDFRILFWGDIDSVVTLKNDVSFAMEDAFTANGIEIPYPHIDISVVGSTESPETEISDYEDENMDSTIGGIEESKDIVEDLPPSNPSEDDD